MDMSFWFYVLERRRKAEQERKAKEAFIITAITCIIALTATLIYTT